MTTNDTINTILAAKTFAVVGASPNTAKYGYIAWRMLKDYGKTTYAVNPNAQDIEGEKTYPTLASLPETPEVVVAVVPHAVTETLPEQLSSLGIRYFWMQPGAESQTAIDRAESFGIAAVHSGPCIMVALRTHSRTR